MKVSAATEEPNHNGGVEGVHLRSAEDNYSSGTPRMRQWREQLTDQKRRNAFLRARQALDDKVMGDRAAAELAERAQEARVGLEGNQMAVDPRAKRRISLPWSVVAVLVVAVIDGLPAYWAAEALGHGFWSTVLVAAILVGAITGFAILMTHFKREANKRMFALAAGLALAMIAVQTLLRMNFLVVTTDSTWKEAALEGGLLAAITTSLVWVGYLVLDHAEPTDIWRERRSVVKLERQARRAESAADEASKRYFAAMEGLKHIEHARVGQRAELHEGIAQLSELISLPSDDLLDMVREANAGPNAKETA
jgi:hypothetical protein